MRWSARRKAEVAISVIAGLATREEMIAKHDLSREELENWIIRYEAHGAEALKIKNIQMR